MSTTTKQRPKAMFVLSMKPDTKLKRQNTPPPKSTTPTANHIRLGLFVFLSVVYNNFLVYIHLSLLLFYFILVIYEIHINLSLISEYIFYV